jgi:hypothetical protein
MLKVLIASHDAGGANILSALIKKYQKQFEFINFTSGPAKAIFSHKKIKSYFLTDKLLTTEVINIIKRNSPDLILTGTGWQSDFERNFLSLGRENRIITMAFLDNWSHYRERFGNVYNWKGNLPDYICVGDNWALRVAVENKFPKNRLLLVENPYFEEMFKHNSHDHNNRLANIIRILFLSEPITEHAFKVYGKKDYWGFSEQQILKNLLEVINSLKKNRTYKLRIRLHPAEEKNKYAECFKENDYKIKRIISYSSPFKNSLIKDCGWADIVIGINSTALVIALQIGKKVISYIPSSKYKCCLPQNGIKKISSLKVLQSALSNYHFDNEISSTNKLQAGKIKHCQPLFLKKVYKIFKDCHHDKISSFRN